jgi:hypothetical protein
MADEVTVSYGGINQKAAIVTFGGGSTPASGAAGTTANPLVVTSFGGGGSGGTATAANPTYTEGATNQALSLDLGGRLRTLLNTGFRTTKALTYLRINIAASGDTALVAAAASQTTRVYRIRLRSAAAVTVQVKNGATVLESFVFGASGGSVTFDLTDEPYYITGANTALNLNLSAAVQVDGAVEYLTSA